MIDFIQILYDESHREKLYPFARPYYSCGLTPYFENAIIAGIVPTLNADYISVCSWRLKQKRGDTIVQLGGMGKDELSIAKIQAAMPFDVAILTPQSRSHKPLFMARNWHGKAWVDAYDAFKPFLSQFGKVPDELTHTIYENHFIARADIYKEYVETCLKPAMEFMKDKPVFFADAGYINRKRDKDLEHAQKLLASWGRTDYPLTPFILERLFSIWIQGKGFKVVNL